MSMMRTGAAVAMCDGAAAAATSAGHLRSDDRSFSAHISRRLLARAPKRTASRKYFLQGLEGFTFGSRATCVPRTRAARRGLSAASLALWRAGSLCII